MTSAQSSALRSASLLSDDIRTELAADDLPDKWYVHPKSPEDCEFTRALESLGIVERLPDEPEHWCVDGSTTMLMEVWRLNARGRNVRQVLREGL